MSWARIVTNWRLVICAVGEDGVVVGAVLELMELWLRVGWVGLVAWCRFSGKEEMAGTWGAWVGGALLLAGAA